MNSLDMKYAFSVLNCLLDSGQLMKSDLFRVVRNNNTLDKLIDALQSDGLVSVEEKIIGRRTYSISLTKRGRTVAGYLRLAKSMTTADSADKQRR